MFKKLLSGFILVLCAVSLSHAQGLPSSLDWRSYSGTNYVSAVTNQTVGANHCGSCSFMAVVGGMESMILLNGGSMPDLSEQFLVSCAATDGCSGVSHDLLAQFVIKWGTIPESDFAWTATSGLCSNAPANWQSTAKVYRPWGIVGFSNNDAATIKSALYNYGPQVATYFSYDEPMQLPDEGAFTGVYVHDPEYVTGAGHAILIIGYVDDDSDPTWGGGYFIMKNSWGGDWGEGLPSCGYGSCPDGQRGFSRVAYSQVENTVQFGKVGIFAFYSGWGASKVITATQPTSKYCVPPGRGVTSAWDVTGMPGTAVSAALYQGSNFSADLGTTSSIQKTKKVEYKGMAAGTIPGGTVTGTTYRIKLTGNSSPAVSAYSSSFTVAPAGLATSSIGRLGAGGKIANLGTGGKINFSPANTKYIRAGATGNGSGDDWTNAYTTWPTFVRGQTYYVADGTYSSLSASTAESGTTLITIKKATVANHGTSTGWNNTYGDGQAVLGSTMTFSTGYWTVDGNGTHTIPSSATADYGFRVSSACTDCVNGVLKIGTTVAVSNVTVKYTHFYNSTNSEDGNNGTVMVRWHPSYVSTYTKIQNCLIENGGKDGLQISRSNYILVERTYLRHLGKLTAESPDYHGQAVQVFYGASDLVFRWNMWDECEGQALISIGKEEVNDRVRFYGNIVFCPYGASCIGFNTSSGGVIADAWGTTTVNGLYDYNNTFVGLDTARMRMYSAASATDAYGYNNIYYDNDNASYVAYDAYGYHLVGTGANPGGTGTETGMTSGKFTSYTGNVFTLTSGTTAGITLTSQPWWDSSADGFFGQLDYATDMLGNTRGADGTWDRGAFEYVTP